jgi:predicted TIM-barrel fold metal-dependent hydrolase
MMASMLNRLRLSLAALALVTTVGGAFGQSSAGTTPPDQLLLKDYRPSSIYKIAQTLVDKARFPIIDVHSHAYVQTREALTAWVTTMDAVGIEKTIVMVGGTGQRLDDAVALFKRYPARFEVWSGLDLSGADQPGFTARVIAELERGVALGVRGVGELSDKGRGLRGSGGMHVDDPRMDPIFERLADLGLPVNIHVDEDQWMYEAMDGSNDGLMNAFKWRIPAEDGVLGHDEVIAALDRAVRKHPRTTFIACHFANTTADLPMLARMLDASPNLYADIAARYGETSPIPRTMRTFYEKYQDRLLYGTDMGTDAGMYRSTFRILETEDEHFYLETLRLYHWPYHGFGLPEGILRKVYRDNALKVLKR